MTFLEFFEALIGCAEVFVTEAVVKDPTTPRPSTVMTPEQSMFSIPVSRSRLDSQVTLTFELTCLCVTVHFWIMSAQSITWLAKSILLRVLHTFTRSFSNMEYMHFKRFNILACVWYEKTKYLNKYINFFFFGGGGHHLSF